MMRRMFAVLFGLMLTGMGVLVVPTAAQAAPTYEWNTAVAGTPPSDRYCISMTGALACFRPYGDQWWVLDTEPDGRSAVAAWENYPHTEPGETAILYRWGACVNKLGAGNWGVCNKDYYEGSDLDFAACVYDSADGTWHGCSSMRRVVNNN